MLRVTIIYLCLLKESDILRFTLSPQPVIARLVPGNPVKNSAALAAILNDSSEGFSEKYQVHKLVYFEGHGEMLSAIHREKRMKKWTRKTKVMLIERSHATRDAYLTGLPGTSRAMTNEWRDLYDDIVGELRHVPKLLLFS